MFELKEKYSRPRKRHVGDEGIPSSEDLSVRWCEAQKSNSLKTGVWRAEEERGLS